VDVHGINNPKMKRRNKSTQPKRKISHTPATACILHGYMCKPTMPQLSHTTKLVVAVAPVVVMLRCAGEFPASGSHALAAVVIVDVHADTRQV
jgi:hypothetical protein